MKPSSYNFAPMRLLLTAFEPFAGLKRNASLEALRAVVAVGVPNVRLHTAVLPVDATSGPNSLIRAVRRAKPEVVVCLGQAARRPLICIERLGVNLLDFRIADNRGKKIIDKPVVRGGPAAYFTTLPHRAMLRAMHRAGVPAELSQDAGTYLCNQVTYTLMHLIATEFTDVRGGFIHLPALPEQAIGQRERWPTMAVETSAMGIISAIRAIAPKAPRATPAPQRRSNAGAR